MTKELENRFKKVGSQRHNPDPIVIARYFHPYVYQTWFATEYEPTTKMFFGYICVFDKYRDVWKNFALKELEEPCGFRTMFNRKMHRGLCSIAHDMNFSEKPLSQALKEEEKPKQK